MRLSARHRRRLARRLTIVDDELSADPVLRQVVGLFAVPEPEPAPEPRRRTSWRGRLAGFLCRLRPHRSARRRDRRFRWHGDRTWPRSIR